MDKNKEDHDKTVQSLEAQIAQLDKDLETIQSENEKTEDKLREGFRRAENNF
jgi:prefoldin subunit 5